MFNGIPIIRFGTTDGRKANVFINNRPAGAIRRFEGTIWTYGAQWPQPGGFAVGDQAGHSASPSARSGFMIEVLAAEIIVCAARRYIVMGS